MLPSLAASPPPRTSPVRPPAPPRPLAAAPASRPAGPVGGVLPLPGGLDGTPVLNSNHPEIVRAPGVALSTLALSGPAHLARTFTGPFEVFTHHVNGTGRDLHQAIVLHNDGARPVTVTLGPSAVRTGLYGLFFKLPRVLDGVIKAIVRDRDAVTGPGPAVAEALLAGRRQRPEEALVVPPGQTVVLDARRLVPWAVASSKWQLASDGPVRAAVLFDAAPLDAAGADAVLRRGTLAGRNPADLPPTPPGGTGGRFIFGRVAGIQQGAAWRGTLGAQPGRPGVVLGEGPVALAWPIATKRGHLLGTGQDQTAPVTQRLSDAAYAAHGNYGLTYDLALPLRNASSRARRVELWLDSPEPTPGMPLAFSGPVEVTWTDPQGRAHRVLRRLNLRPEGRARVATLEVPAGATLDARVRLVYPADATPPQVLRLRDA